MGPPLSNMTFNTKLKKHLYFTTRLYCMLVQRALLVGFVLWGAICTAFSQTASDRSASPQTSFAKMPFPLPLDKSSSYEVLSQQHRVEHSEDVATEGWRHEGLGQLFQGRAIRLLVPIVTGKRAVGSPDDPDYCTFGQASIVKDLNGCDLTAYNRIVMDVLPRRKGTGVMNLNLAIDDATPADVGAHLINLTPNQWNHVVFDMSGLPREHVYALRIYTDVKGRNLFVGDSLVFTLRNIQLQQTTGNAKEVGWDVAPGQIAYSMSGYFPESEKKAVLGFPAETFDLLDARSGKVVMSGKVVRESTTIGSFYVANFTLFRQKGSFILKAGSHQTRPFRIGPDAFLPSQWRVLSFIYGQRCGVPVPGIHGACHHDLFSLHNGKKTSYAGGWHDAGDLSQQTLQSGDVAFALAEAYSHLSHKKNELARRLKAEAFHGFRFILRQRLGNGWHASSMGLLHWTDGIVGTGDDIITVRVQDNSFDNFLYAGYEAYAARVFAGDPLADSLRQAAIEDFNFGKQKFDQHGFDTFLHMMEHTYSTPHSLYMATMSWSASQLYRLTGDNSYAQLAADYIRLVLQCQARDGSRNELIGFFYRDTNRQTPVHSIHQSREQLFAMALAELILTQPTNGSNALWRQAARYYGGYLKSLRPYTAPYGMMASGTYRIDEWRDSDAFNRLNLFAPADALDRFKTQLSGGIRIDSCHYVRRFPTWFSIFNGNEAILLTMGKAAAVLGNLLDDDTLRDIGRQQLYWTVGANPFCQSLIYGEGFNYPSMDSFSSGEMTGEMPVGIRTKGDADIPYWPQTNNACYKEVWVTSAGKWLSLLSEFGLNCNGLR